VYVHKNLRLVTFVFEKTEMSDPVSNMSNPNVDSKSVNTADEVDDEVHKEVDDQVHNSVVV
jgi:hypothetical protein